jgi:hypothetical protein
MHARLRASDRRRLGRDDLNAWIISRDFHGILTGE